MFSGTSVNGPILGHVQQTEAYQRFKADQCCFLKLVSNCNAPSSLLPLKSVLWNPLNHLSTKNCSLFVLPLL